MALQISLLQTKNMVMQLLEKGASVSVDRYKAYKIIIKNGDLSMFKLFLTHGAPIDMGNYYPLEWAIKMEHLDIVNYLFQHEDVDIDKDLATCFLGNYQRQSFRNMIWDHFNTLERDSYTTIITSAMRDDDLKILKMVEENMPIQKLLNTFMQDNYKHLYQGHMVPCYLIDKYPELINDQEAKLLRIFSRYGNLKMVQYLVEKGANIHVRNNLPFTNALNNGHKDIVLYLLSLNVRIFTTIPIITSNIKETLPCYNILKNYPKMNLEEIANTILQSILQSKNVKQRGKYVDQLNQLIYHFPYLNAKLSKNIDAML